MSATLTEFTIEDTIRMVTNTILARETPLEPHDKVYLRNTIDGLLAQVKNGNQAIQLLNEINQDMLR